MYKDINGVRIYDNYDECPNGWHSECRNSPDYGTPIGWASVEDAEKMGFEKIWPKSPAKFKEFVVVPTSFKKGFTRVASKEYYSVWGRISAGLRLGMKGNRK